MQAGGNITGGVKATIHNNHYYGTPDAAPVDDCGEPEQATDPKLTKRRLGIAVAVIVGVIWIIAATVSSHAGSPSLLTESGKRPADAQPARIIPAVVDTLRSCAKAIVLAPANCPQSYDDYGQPATNVQWALHGDPGDGAEVNYHGDRFYVVGNATMSVAYHDSNTDADNFVIMTVPYMAQVTWSRNGPYVVSVQSFSGQQPSRPIVKRDPRVPWSQVAPVLQAAFAQCMAATSSPLPPQCPQDPSTASETNGTWSLDGSPIINTRQTFDNATGLIHVVGSYAATANFTNSFLGIQSSYTIHQSGTYDASLVVDTGKLVVLQITSQN